MFLTNHALKFQSHPGGIKVEYYAKLNIKYPITEYDVCLCTCVHVSVLTWNGGGIPKGRNV